MMRIEAYIALAAQTYPLQARDMAIRGQDPSSVIELARACAEMAAHGGDVVSAVAFDGLLDIDLKATCNGMRRRLMEDDSIPVERLYELGLALNTVIVALQMKQQEIKARIEKAQKGE